MLLDMTSIAPAAARLSHSQSHLTQRRWTRRRNREIDNIFEPSCMDPMWRVGGREGVA